MRTTAGDTLAPTWAVAARNSSKIDILASEE
jgi:hypothetical protein